MYLDLGTITFQANFSSPERDDIIRCLEMLLMTPEGTCPCYRDFGISQVPMDQPLDVATGYYAVDIMEKAAKFEPRVFVREVQFEANPVDGKLKIKVVLYDG